MRHADRPKSQGRIDSHTTLDSPPRLEDASPDARARWRARVAHNRRRNAFSFFSPGFLRSFAAFKKREKLVLTLPGRERRREERWGEVVRSSAGRRCLPKADAGRGWRWTDDRSVSPAAPSAAPRHESLTDGPENGCQEKVFANILSKFHEISAIFSTAS